MKMKWGLLGVWEEKLGELGVGKRSVTDQKAEPRLTGHFDCQLDWIKEKLELSRANFCDEIFQMRLDHENSALLNPYIDS